jgi:PHD-finger
MLQQQQQKRAIVAQRRQIHRIAAPQTMAKQDEERRIIAESRKMLERRKELDMAWQRQLEKDMDAVCVICDDGEVTPDNQILFCEACNVVVHQTCYGIDQVPQGDYYCLACRRLGRDKRRDGSCRL